MRHATFAGFSALVLVCSTNAAQAVAVAPAFPNLPVAFQANRGQFPPDVRYAGRGSGLDVYLTNTEASLVLEGADPVRLRWHNAARPKFSPAELLKTTTNYYLGNESSKWYTGIANYGQVKLQGLYPGIDLVYHGLKDSLEFDFIVAPGSEPSAIAMVCEGANDVRVDGGDLVLETRAGPIRQRRPVVYQEIGGKRVELVGSYRIDGKIVRFEVGDYDRAQTLVVDPVVVYVNYPGTSISGVATDTAGNLYATGFGTVSPTAGAYQSSPKPVFVMKLDPNGALIYATYLGGNYIYFGGSSYGGSAFSRGIAVDSAGNAYIAGYAYTQAPSSDPGFPTTAAAFQATWPYPSSGGAAFVSKLSATGGTLLYSTFLAGTGTATYAQAYAIAVDSAGAAYVTGSANAGFPVTSGAFQTAFAQSFVTKLNPAGSGLVYSTYFADSCTAIAVDSTGAAYLTGTAASGAFPTTPGAFQTTMRGLNDAFAAKLNPSGSALVYATLLGGSANDSGNSIAVDAGGNAYIAGLTNSTDFPVTAGAYSTKLGGSNDGFVTKLNPNGSAEMYSTYVDGVSSLDYTALTGIAVDSSSVAYVTGHTQSNDFPVTADAFDSQQATIAMSAAPKNVLFTLSAQGDRLTYSTFLNGADYLALDPLGNVVAGGSVVPNGYPYIHYLTTQGFLARVVFHPATPLIGFTTSPPPTFSLAASFTVSGTGCAPGVYTAPLALSWTPGANCTVTVSSLTQGGTRNVFSSWSDGNTSNPRTFTAGTGTATYVANLGRLQYTINSTINPPGAGSITFAPPPPASDGFYDAGSVVTVTAVPAQGNNFSAFSGDLNGSANPQNLTIKATPYVNADFCAISLNPGSQAVSALAFNGSFTLQTPGGCLWSAGSDVSWLRSPQSSTNLATFGNGSAIVNYAIAANTTGSQRVGHVIVTGPVDGLSWKFTVTQAASNTLQIPSLVSLTPFQGSGPAANLTLVYAHPSGFAAIQSAEFIINPRWETYSRTSGCYVKYSPATGLFTLIADDGSSIAGTAAPGSSTNISNSSCTLNAANSSATGSGNTLTIVASLTFSASFGGQRHIWMQAIDNNNLSTNWLVYGVWFPAATTVTATPWYRISDPYSKTYLYTSDANEYRVLGTEGFTQQGASGLVMTGPATVAGVSNIAWYRVYVNATASHFWTSDRNEFLTLVNQQQAYVGEGVAAFVMPYINAQGQVSPPVTNSIPFWRAAYQGSNLHFWTSDPDEYNGTNGKHLPAGYVGEGIASYIFPASGAQGLGIPVTAHQPVTEEDDGTPAVVSVSSGRSATATGVVAPGQLLTIRGRHLGGRVLLNGVPVQVVSTGANEFQVVAPEDLAGPDVTLELEHRGRRFGPMKLAVVLANPTILGTNQFGTGNAEAQGEDGIEITAQHPAAQGSVVALFATGFGAGSKELVEVHVGGLPAEVLSMRPSGTRPGVIEVRFRVPSVAASPFQPVVLHVGNQFSAPGVGLPIR